MKRSKKMDTNLLTIEVPEDLLFQWYQEEFGGDKDSFSEWYYLDSTADFTVGLYDWLSAHGYKIEREN